MKNVKKYVSFFLIPIALGCFIIVRDYIRSVNLKNYEIVGGVVLYKAETYPIGNTIGVEFTLNGKKIESIRFNPGDCFYSLNEGDSVLIKYAIDSPEIVELVDCR